MERTFQIVSAVKTAQKGQKTAFDGTMVFTGDPRRASMKEIRGVCTLTIVIAEIKMRTIDGVKEAFPVFDSNGMPKMWKYDLKRESYKDDMNVELDGQDVTFKYKSTIVKSHGRVVPT